MGKMIEVNVDALVGPTHHYAGLGVGNLASQQHSHQVSRPKQAALQGLKKAMLLVDLNIPQFVLLPPCRPRLDWLAELGFGGDIATQLEQAFHEAPKVLSAAYSSAFMWAANSGVFTPACDASDGANHVTPANLISSWHRALEAEERRSEFHALFRGVPAKTIHSPLPAIVPLRDEGAANHMRLCGQAGDLACNVFVHGEEDGRDHASQFYPRHTRAASEMIARRHGLDPERTFHLHQHPAAISAGAFHNDVIATSHRQLLIHHEKAFLDAEATLDRLEKKFHAFTGEKLNRILVAESTLSLENAIHSYFFNSQIVSPITSQVESPNMVIICPEQCRQIEQARRLVARLIDDSEVPIEDVHYVALDQSMANGGGPACLRLRMDVDQRTLAALNANQRLTHRSYDALQDCIEKFYPEQLQLSDLAVRDTAVHATQAAEELRKCVQQVGKV